MTNRKTRKLNCTVTGICVYNSSLEVPADLSISDAVKYAKEHMDEIPLTAIEWIGDAGELDEENCSFDDEEYDYGN